MSEEENKNSDSNHYFNFDNSLSHYFVKHDFHYDIARYMLLGMEQLDIRVRNKFRKYLYKVNYEIVVNSDSRMRDEIVFFDETKKIIARSQYELLGAFNTKEKFWKWIWAFPAEEVKQKHKYIASRMFEATKDKNIPFYKFFMLSSLFLCKEKIQLDVFIALCISYVNNRFVLPYKANDNEDYYIILTEKDNMVEWERIFIESLHK